MSNKIRKLFNGLFFVAMLIGGGIKFFEFMKNNGHKELAIVIIVIVLALVIWIVFKVFTAPPFYDDVRAKEVTWNNISDDIKKEINKEDVDLVLDLEFEYQQKIGLTGQPVGITEDSQKSMEELREKIQSQKITLNESDLVKFIIVEAKKRGKKYSSDEIDAILNGEEVYLEQIGVLKGDKEQK